MFTTASSTGSGGGSGSAPNTGGGGNTSTTSATTTTAAGTAKATIVARIVSATARRHGKNRTVGVQIRVSRPGKARLQLLLKKATKLSKTFTVKGGSNELKARIPSGLKKGAYTARITLTAPNARSAVYKATVRVPR